jgi:hypothetical protein
MLAATARREGVNNEGFILQIAVRAGQNSR